MSANTVRRVNESVTPDSKLDIDLSSSFSHAFVNICVQECDPHVLCGSVIHNKAASQLASLSAI